MSRLYIPEVYPMLPVEVDPGFALPAQITNSDPKLFH
jgi:hypothetical protein